MNLEKILLEEIFPYEYFGVGYFRKKGVPIGQKAEILHGEQAIRFVFDEVIKKIMEEKK